MWGKYAPLWALESDLHLLSCGRTGKKVALSGAGRRTPLVVPIGVALPDVEDFQRFHRYRSDDSVLGAHGCFGASVTTALHTLDSSCWGFICERRCRHCLGPFFDRERSESCGALLGASATYLPLADIRCANSCSRASIPYHHRRQ